MRVIYGLGRFVYGSFFLYNGINHFKNAEALEAYAAFKQRPNPELEVKGSGVLMIAAGASLAFGIKPRLGALGVLGFLAAATPAMHDFWNEGEAANKQQEQIHFSKNVALAAAAVAFLGEA